MRNTSLGHPLTLSPHHLVIRAFGLTLLTVLAGCGRDGPVRYEVAGTVNYGGQTVQAGRVIFEPDTSQGNSGPAGYADIEAGRYRTMAGKGVVGGPHLVRVICLSGGGTDSELPEGNMLCPEFREQLELPQADTTHDIEVPGDLKW